MGSLLANANIGVTQIAHRLGVSSGKVMWMKIGVAVTALAALPITYYVTALIAWNNHK